MATAHSASAVTDGQLFNASKYSDLTVICGSDQYSLHRAIVCPRIQCFDETCNEDSVATSKVTIGLDDDDPQTVNRMLVFVYTNDYPDGEIPHHQRPSKKEKSTPTQTHARAASSSALKSRDEVYHDDKLMDNVLVYAIAEKYGLPKLQELAQSRVEILTKSDSVYTGQSDFSDVLRTTFELTPADDRGLRDIFLRLCAENFPDVLQHPGLEEVVHGIASISFGILGMKSSIDGQALMEALDSKAMVEAELSNTKARLNEAAEEKRTALLAEELAIEQKDDAVEKQKSSDRRIQDAHESIKHHSDLHTEAIKARDNTTKTLNMAIKARDTAASQLAEMTRLKDAAARGQTEAVVKKEAAIKELNEAIKARDAALKDKGVAIRQKVNAVANKDEILSSQRAKLEEIANNTYEWEECRNCGTLFDSYLQTMEVEGEFAVRLRCRDCYCRHDVGHGLG